MPVHRRSLKLRLLVLIALIALPALGAPLDKAALKKIDEAINEHYLATNFDKAEGVLLGTVKACGKKCSPSVVAKAYMYVGIVRGSGKKDQSGAQEAFEQALSIDPKVKLDGELATPDTKATFEQSGGAGGAAAASPDEPEDDAPAAASVPGGMECTPDVTEAETRRPIPVSCTTDEDATRAELRYKEFAGEGWQTLKMTKSGDEFRAQIPCTATMNVGALRFYVVAKDSAGDTLDSKGTKSKPVELQLVAESSEEPPAYPDDEPPARCAEEEECPPDFPGCDNKKKKKREGKGWGSSCEQTSECAEGLACMSGSCDTAPKCDTNEDCTGGLSCVEGTCQEPDGGDEPASGDYKRNLLGLHISQDIAIVSGTDVCAATNTENWICYNANGPRSYAQGQGTNIASGTSIAHTTAFVSYDRAFTPNLTAGIRVGYAFTGKSPGDFLPIRAELRAQYFFGSNALGNKGFRPFVHVGGGLAQVDAKVRVAIPSDNNAPYDAWKSMGKSFAMLGGGLMYALSPSGGLVLDVQAMILFPASGVVLQPSLGYVLGF
jgi:hypothetical protein